MGFIIKKTFSIKGGITKIYRYYLGMTSFSGTVCRNVTTVLTELPQAPAP